MAELETGAAKSQRPAKAKGLLHDFLAQIVVADFDASAASEYGLIRGYLEKRGEPIGPLDLLIAAHARSLGVTLVTANLREFRRVPRLRCEDWE